MLRRMLAGALVATCLVLGTAGPAAADCMAFEDPDTALRTAIATNPTVFVGTIFGTRAEGRSAIVNVLEVWRGPAFPAQVVVNGSESLEPNTATSVDRTFMPGQKYLFIPQGNRSPFTDNICSLTQEFTDAVEKFRPAGARGLGTDNVVDSNGFPTVGVALGSTAGVAMILALWVVLRRRAAATSAT